MRGSVERRQQAVFFALTSGIRLGVSVLGEQTRFTDIPFVLHPREASLLVSRDADVLQRRHALGNGRNSDVWAGF